MLVLSVGPADHGRRFDRLAEDRLLAFSDAIGRDATLEDWQRQQAVRAVELYLKGFLREVQECLGHASVETTMIYTHVIRTLTNKAESPLDAI